DLRADRGTEADPVRALRRLDLDDVGAHRGPPRRGEWSGPERGEVQHRHAGERTLPDRVRLAADRMWRRDRVAAVLAQTRRGRHHAVMHRGETERRAGPHEARTGLLHERIALDELGESRKQLTIADDGRGHA